jgi:hypothetical protein
MIVLIKIAFQLLADLARFAMPVFQPARPVQAGTLFLRQQSALFKQREIQPWRQ